MNTAEYDEQYRRERLADLYVLASASAWQGSPPVRDLYFIQCGSDGPIKVGVAIDVVKRLASLQTASPYELILVGTLPALGAMERYIHWDFEDVRIRGEWFHATRTLLAMAEGEFPETTLDRPALTLGPNVAWRDVDATDLEGIASHWRGVAETSPRWRLSLDWWRSELQTHPTIGVAMNTPLSKVLTAA